jgi:hypothetical protein
MSLGCEPVDLDYLEYLAEVVSSGRYSKHARSGLVAHTRRAAAELRECRQQRDGNLANVRRIDDLRIAETAQLQQELDAAQAEVEALRASENEWEGLLGRLEAELHRIAERFPAEGYPDGDVEWSIRQAGPVATLEQVAYLIGKQQDELESAREVVEAAGPVILNPHLPERVRRLHEARNAYNQAKAGEGA